MSWQWKLMSSFTCGDISSNHSDSCRVAGCRQRIQLFMTQPNGSQGFWITPLTLGGDTSHLCPLLQGMWELRLQWFNHNCSITLHRRKMSVKRVSSHYMPVLVPSAQFIHLPFSRGIKGTGIWGWRADVGLACKKQPRLLSAIIEVRLLHCWRIWMKAAFKGFWKGRDKKRSKPVQKRENTLFIASTLIQNNLMSRVLPMHALSTKTNASRVAFILI